MACLGVDITSGNHLLSLWKTAGAVGGWGRQALVVFFFFFTLDKALKKMFFCNVIIFLNSSNLRNNSGKENSEIQININTIMQNNNNNNTHQIPFRKIGERNFEIISHG